MKRLALSALIVLLASMVQAQTLPVAGRGGGGSGSGTISAGSANDVACYTAGTTIGACQTGSATYNSTNSTLLVPALQTTGTGASITMTNVAGISTPASGKTGIYADSTKKLYCSMNDAGAITCLSGRRGLSFDLGTPGGSALTTAYTSFAYARVPFACTLSGYSLLVDAGTITVKFSRLAAGGIATPTLANSINTSGISIATFSTATASTTMSDFTSTAIAANDILGIHITAVSTATYVNVDLTCDM